jgi:hypothetical protein
MASVNMSKEKMHSPQHPACVFELGVQHQGHDANWVEARKASDDNKGEAEIMKAQIHTASNLKKS